LQSTTAEAEALKMDRKELRTAQLATAAASYYLERSQWQGIESSMAQPRPNTTCHLYVDYGCYDGVDLRLMTKAFWSQAQ